MAAVIIFEKRARKELREEMSENIPHVPIDSIKAEKIRNFAVFRRL